MATAPRRLGSDFRSPYPAPIIYIGTIASPQGQSLSSSRTSAATAEPNADRAPRGRFSARHKGGPGNPFARQVAEIRKLLLNSVPGERLAKIVLAMVEKAEAGDVAAAKLVLQYTVGKPRGVEPDRVEIESIGLRTESTSASRIGDRGRRSAGRNRQHSP